MYLKVYYIDLVCFSQTFYKIFVQILKELEPLKYTFLTVYVRLSNN